MFRLTGGSDCCRDRLCKFGFTWLVAPKEMLSRGLSSLLVSTGVAILFASEPANPVPVFPWSAAAIKRALPR